MFRYSTLGGGENAPVPSGAELIEIVRRRPVWDEITISKEDDAQFPRASLSWHEGHGLVLHCFEDELSWGFFLAESTSLSQPEVDIILGGQVQTAVAACGARCPAEAAATACGKRAPRPGGIPG